MRRMTQREQVLKYIQDFGSITPLDALKDLGIFRLGARVFELREQGYNVETDMIEVPNRYGGKTRIAKYTMGEKECGDNITCST